MTYLLLKFVHYLGMFLWITGIFAWLKGMKIFMQQQQDDRLERREILPAIRPVYIFASHLGASLTLIGGIGMLILNPGFLSQPWVHAKLLLVAGIVVITAIQYRKAQLWAQDGEITLPWWLRITGKLLIVILLLAVFRPF